MVATCDAITVRRARQRPREMELETGDRSRIVFLRMLSMYFVQPATKCRELSYNFKSQFWPLELANCEKVVNGV